MMRQLDALSDQVTVARYELIRIKATLGMNEGNGDEQGGNDAAADDKDAEPAREDATLPIVTHADPDEGRN